MTTQRTSDISQKLDATSRAAHDADQAHVRAATDSVEWERRGWIGRLVRVERARERRRAA